MKTKKRIGLWMALLLLVTAGCAPVKNAPTQTQGASAAPSAAGTSLPSAQAPRGETPTADAGIDLPILDEIDRNTEVATAGAYAKAVKSAEQLLDWGSSTGLDPEEIRAGAQRWRERHDTAQVAAMQEKLRTVDEVYLSLIGAAQENASGAGTKEGAWPWGTERVEPIEIVMAVFGLR